MRELKSRLREMGEQWRNSPENQKTVNKDTGETKSKLPTLAQATNELLKVCHFALIGKGKSDKSPLYVYDLDNGVYTDSDDLIDGLINCFDTRLDPSTFKKIRHLIRIKTDLKPLLEESDLLPVGNGVLNRKTKELNPFSPNYIITSKIATSYVSNPPKPTFNGQFDFDNWLKEISCNDDEVITLLWQLLNEAINPLQTRGKIFILLGEGNNGKGTFQDLVKNLLGAGNYSTLRAEQFKGFELGTLIGKVANIGDDIGNKPLDEITNLKTIATGDALTINEKFGNVYETELKLLCMFSANELPKTYDKSHGWYRRLAIIPFDADFNGQRENKAIKQVYLKDKALLEWVLYKIVEMTDFDKFIEPKRVKNKLKEYKKDNDIIYSFVEDWYLPRDWHNIPFVPIWLITDKINNFVEENQIITQKNLRNIGGNTKKILEELTGLRYEIKQGKVKAEDRAKLSGNENLPEELQKTHKENYMRRLEKSYRGIKKVS